METEGYQVVDVLTPEQVENYKEKFLEWSKVLKSIPPHGVISHYQIGHQDFIWQMRTEPSVMKPFQELYKSDELVSSYDGFGYLPATLKRKDKSWFHIDQEPNDLSFKSVQSLVALTDNTTRTFQCIPGSHLEVANYFKNNPSKTPSKAWQKVKAEEFSRKPITVSVKAGQMIIWDSRLVHCNSYGSPEERIVAYIAYLPRKGLTQKQMLKRQKAFEEKRTTSHWSYPLKLNSLQPQVFGDKSKLIDYKSLPSIEYSPELLSKIKKLL